MDKSRAVYGIDLGTTYSCVAQVDKYDQPTVLDNFEGDMTTPSVVYFENENNVVVGKEAKSMLAAEPEKTVAFVKREMGVDESFDKRTNRFPYHYDPAEISAFILKKIVKDANDRSDNPEPIKDVVITCPAYFGTKERMQTKQAGEIAGLNVLAIINEPTAAAICYGLKTDEQKTVLVYDLGGGTFDITMIRVNGGAIKVVATGGDHHLGGADWDLAFAEYMLGVFNEQNNTSYTFDDDPILKNTLMLEAETKKKILTGRESVKFNIQYNGLSARGEIMRSTYDSLTESLLEETIQKTHELLGIARDKGFAHIDEFLLVGGSSRMPQVKERVDREFGCDAKLHDPDKCVALGAAIYAMNEAYLQAVQEYEEGERDEKPAPLRGDRTRVVNVTSKTYGTDMMGGLVKNLIFANTTLPVKRSDTFVTTVDNQRRVSIQVIESDFTEKDGDVVDVKYCDVLREEMLHLTKDWPQGTPIEVVFQVDKEGILRVEAYVEKDRIDFKLEIEGVKNDEDLQKSKDMVAKASIS